jgi:hypothetical protein
MDRCTSGAVLEAIAGAQPRASPDKGLMPKAN